MNNKLKLLYLVEIFKANPTGLTAPELIQNLDSKGIKCSRKILYDDIKALREFGYGILHTKGRGCKYVLIDETDNKKIQEMFGGVRKHKASDKQNTKLDNNIKE